MASTRRSPRRDPVLLYHIQSDFAAGLAPAQIAEKHELPVYTVTQALRRNRAPHALPDPYGLVQQARTGREPTLLYWIGYVAACGAVYDGPIPTLVLNVDPRDRGHVESLLQDLCEGRPGCEYCQSSTRGLQAYIRDRDLGRLLVRWGLPGDDRSGGSVPVSFIPRSLLAHFIRGWLEGAGQVSLASVGKVVFSGPAAFVDGLRKALRSHVGSDGTFTPKRSGEAALVYHGSAAMRLLRFAYRDPVRSLPRADRLREALGTSRHRPAGARTRNGQRG